MIKSTTPDINLDSRIRCGVRTRELYSLRYGGATPSHPQLLFHVRLVNTFNILGRKKLT